MKLLLPIDTHVQITQAITAVAVAPVLMPFRLYWPLCEPGFASVYLSERSVLNSGNPQEAETYLANALANAFLQLTFCPPTKLSTVTAIARSTSCEVQYSERRILQKASLIRMMASR